MTELESSGRPRVGLVVLDELRAVGLQALIGVRWPSQVLALAGLNSVQLANVDLLVLDSAATSHLFELIATLRRARPGIRILILGESGGQQTIERIIGAGARGFLTYAAREDEICRAVEIILDGSVWAPRKVMAVLLQRAEQAAPLSAAPVRFTRRETEVLQQLVRGRSNREIAVRLEVDEATVKAHLGRLMRKANVANRTALSMKALDAGWA